MYCSQKATVCILLFVLLCTACVLVLLKGISHFTKFVLSTLHVYMQPLSHVLVTSTFVKMFHILYCVILFYWSRF